MDALELGVGCLNALFLAAILYQQTSRTSGEQRVISLNTAKFLVAATAVVVIALAIIAMTGLTMGGEA
jgi:hypothetical protein